MSNNNGPSEGYLLSKGHSYYIFSLLFLLYMFDYIDRLVVVSLFPYLKKDWGLTDTQCGLLVSAVYWSIVLFSFPVSIIIDRWSRKKSIGIMASCGAWPRPPAPLPKALPICSWPVRP